MRLTTFTVVATLAAGLALPAMAQAPSTSGGSGAGISSGASGGASGSSSAGGASGSSQSFTTSNVDPNMPFGAINISTAGANNANMSTFLAGLTDMQRSELSGRCNVINDPSNASRYMQNAKDFCRTYQTASLSGTSGAGSTTPGATGSTGSTTGGASGSAGSGAAGAR